MSGEYSNLNTRLSDLSTESAAQATFILRRKQLIASTGSLPAPAVQEVAELVHNLTRISTQSQEDRSTTSTSITANTDLVRFIQLESTGTRYFLYMVALTTGLYLAALYDTGTAFSTVRRETQSFRRKLLEAGPVQWESQASPTLASPQDHPDSTVAMKTAPLPQETLVSGLTSAGTADEIHPVDIQPEISNQEPETAYEPGQTDEIPDDGEKIPASSPDSVESAGYHDISEIDPQQSIPQADASQSESHSGEQASVGLPINPYITYSCLLIPRMPEHLLNSNLSTYLFKWMGQLCIAYGWRLEHLSIHSGHIQWIAGAPLATSPAFLVRTLRQKTSQQIFTQFPPLTNENPSGDFWAPGFYISGGKQTFQPHQIDQFINEIREQQGVYQTNLNE